MSCLFLCLYPLNVKIAEHFFVELHDKRVNGKFKKIKSIDENSKIRETLLFLLKMYEKKDLQTDENISKNIIDFKFVSNPADPNCGYLAHFNLYESVQNHCYSSCSMR